MVKKKDKKKKRQRIWGNLDGLYHVVDGKTVSGPHKHMSGYVFGLYGDCTTVFGCISGLYGNCTGVRIDMTPERISEIGRFPRLPDGMQVNGHTDIVDIHRAIRRFRDKKRRQKKSA